MLLRYMSTITNKRIEKTIHLANLFERYEESNLAVRTFCKKEGIHTSRFYYWRDRYQREGKKGLVDKRQGNAYKVKDIIRQYIQRVKIKDPLKALQTYQNKLKTNSIKISASVTSREFSKNLDLTTQLAENLGSP